MPNKCCRHAVSAAAKNVLQNCLLAMEDAFFSRQDVNLVLTYEEPTCIF